MRRVRELLRLRLDAGPSAQQAAARMGVARSTLREMQSRFEKSGLSWPLRLDLTDAELEGLLQIVRNTGAGVANGDPKHFGAGHIVRCLDG